MDDALPFRPARPSLRDLIRSDEILPLPGVFNGYSVRLAASAGFLAACVTGSGVSENRLGMPDVGILDLTENVASTRAMAAVADGMYLIADGDTGYGNAINVQYTVARLEEAGASGVMLEDQVAPKRCGHMAGKEVIDAEEMLGKIEAALAARRSDEFVIEARTDSGAVLGLEESIRRANLYAAAGADLIIEDALLTREHIARFAGEVRAPVAVNMGFGIRALTGVELLSAAELQALGVAVVGYPRVLSAAAVRGMQQSIEVLRQSLRDGTVIERPDLVASAEETNSLMRLEEIYAAEQNYVRGRK